MAIFATSDTHLCHTLPDIFLPRGFQTADEHTDGIIKLWNDTVTDDDDIYHLGDMFMSDQIRGLEAVRELRGRIHLYRGNHDTDKKMEALMTLPNIVECRTDLYSNIIKFKKHEYYLSHWPTMVGNRRESVPRIICLHGHTHSPDKFQFLEFGCYNVSMDAQNCRPVRIDNIREEFKAEIQRRLNT